MKRFMEPRWHPIHLNCHEGESIDCQSFETVTISWRGYCSHKILVSSARKIMIFNLKKSEAKSLWSLTRITEIWRLHTQMIGLEIYIYVCKSIQKITEMCFLWWDWGKFSCFFLPVNSNIHPVDSPTRRGRKGVSCKTIKSLKHNRKSHANPWS